MKDTFHCGGLTKVHIILPSMACLASQILLLSGGKRWDIKKQ